MAYRQIVLDTETTGLSVDDGHRIIEIGCVELIDRKLTGNHFHQYINPERIIDAGAIAVHGITNEFLQDKPRFKEIATDFMDFVADAELVIHNAPFDVGFLNNELRLTRLKWQLLEKHCRIFDTLTLARTMHAGQRNSLDALCKRYAVDNTKRELHGALMDAQLLAHVYLAMTGGQGSFFDSLEEKREKNENAATYAVQQIEQFQLAIIKANSHELQEHEAYLQMLLKKGKCVWLDD